MTKTDLRAVSGRRLRWQYFGPAAWFGLGMAGFIPYMIAVISLMMGRFNWADLLESLWISAVLCGGMSLFFFGLTALNRACFGRVICVLGEDGLYHSGGMIHWGEIKRIEYIIDRPRRYRGCREKFCRGVVYADGGSVVLTHAPHCLLRYAREFVPGLECGIARESKRDLALEIGIAAVCVWLVPLFR